MAPHQEIRISQMVLQLGPGAILESTAGPRLIPLPEFGLFDMVNPEKYAIDLPHLSKILEGRRVFRIPSNASLNIPSQKPLYKTRPFPNWKLCVEHNVLYLRECPKCSGKDKHSSRTETIRFVVACPKGHLDDVDWFAAVHSGKTCKRTDYYIWISKGGSMSDTVIRCPICNAETTLANIYRKPHSCSGRFPEREPLGSQPLRSDCDEEAYVIQRQSTALRIPEVITVLMVPPYSTEIQLALSRSSVRSSLVTFLGMKKLWDAEKQQLAKEDERLLSEIGEWIEWIAEEKNASSVGLRDDERERLRILKNRNGSDLIRAIRHVLEHREEENLETLLQYEFDVLRRGAITGIPSETMIREAGPLLEIDPKRVRIVQGPKRNVSFRIAPVRKLYTVTVQVGYRRAVGPYDSDTDSGFPGELVSVESEWNGEKWLPGYGAEGEGIFITLADDEGWHPPLKGESAERWSRKWEEGGKYAGPPSGKTGKVSPHPVFYWWHTFSHLLLRVLAVESGYTLASIRERIYVEADESGNARGGLLLYTTGRGVSGSMGGLIALVPVFEHLLLSALEAGSVCSADPLCFETVTEHSGAACHACVLVSETSCENRNMWLDRKIINDNMP